MTRDNRTPKERKEILQKIRDNNKVQQQLQNHFMGDIRYHETDYSGVFIEKYRGHYWLVSDDWKALHIGCFKPTTKQVSQYVKCGRITY